MASQYSSSASAPKKKDKCASNPEASECANDQGKFWPFHDQLFANQSALGEENLLNQNLAALVNAPDGVEANLRIKQDIAIQTIKAGINYRF